MLTKLGEIEFEAGSAVEIVGEDMYGYQPEGYKRATILADSPGPRGGERVEIVWSNGKEMRTSFPASSLRLIPV